MTHILIDGMQFPLKHAYIVRANFRRGTPWWACSPMYDLTREQVAAIVSVNLPPTKG